MPEIGFPEPVMSFAVTPKIKGEEEKVATAIRRLAEEDPTLRASPRPADRGGDPLRDEPDARRGRARARQAPLRRRRRAASAARPVPGDDPQRVAARTPATRSRPAAAASSATARSCSSRSRATSATSSSTRSSAASSRRASGPPSTRAIQEAMRHGELAGAPVQGVRVTARRRLVPQRRLVGDGVQDRRLDGVQGGVLRRPSRSCSSRSWSSR